MKPVTLYCLHGFLGLPSDWDFLKSEYAIEKVDPFQIHAPAPQGGSSALMMDWACAFNEKVALRDERRILLGYSMGGRLALHALTRNPSLWDAAILVSTNPGIPVAEKEARIAADEAWARRFESESWDSVVASWEKLPVFGGKTLPFTKTEAQFSRAALAGALRWWSVGRQEDLGPRLSSLSMPVLWVTGEEDTRYSEIAREIQARLSQNDPLSSSNSNWKFAKIPGAAHRVPWEASESFQRALSDFLKTV